MLVLSRRVGETIVVNDEVVVEVLRVGGGQVQLGITAPRDQPIDRGENHDRERERRAGVA